MADKAIIGTLISGVVAVGLLAGAALADAPPDWFERAAARGELEGAGVSVATTEAAPPDWFERAAARGKPEEAGVSVATTEAAPPDWFERTVAKYVG